MANVNDFAWLNGKMYLSTSDGNVLRATESIWQFSFNFGTQSASVLPVFQRGSPATNVVNGQFVVASKPGDAVLFKV